MKLFVRAYICIKKFKIEQILSQILLSIIKKSQIISACKRIIISKKTDDYHLPAIIKRISLIKINNILI